MLWWVGAMFLHLLACVCCLLILPNWTPDSLTRKRSLQLIAFILPTIFAIIGSSVVASYLSSSWLNLFMIL